MEHVTETLGTQPGAFFGGKLDKKTRDSLSWTVVLSKRSAIALSFLISED